MLVEIPIIIFELTISAKSVNGSNVMLIVIITLLLLHFVAYVSMYMSKDLNLPLFPQDFLKSIDNAFLTLLIDPVMCMF